MATTMTDNHKIMKATKYTLTIDVNALSKDCFKDLVVQALRLIENEVDSGSLSMDDGDNVAWCIESQNVNI